MRKHYKSKKWKQNGVYLGKMNKGNLAWNKNRSIIRDKFEKVEMKIKYNFNGKSSYHLLKPLCINQYGGKCECCAENIMEFLTIDHKDAIGPKYRRLPDGKYGTGIFLYRYLFKNNFPKYLIFDDKKVKLRVLCMNCNMATIRGKICPHQQIST